MAGALATRFDPATKLFEQFSGYFQLEEIDVAAQRGCATPIDTCLGPERIRDRNLIPWRHQREMNVGGCDQANRKSLQFSRHLREFAGNLRRRLERDENAGRTRPA